MNKLFIHSLLPISMLFAADSFASSNTIEEKCRENNEANIEELRSNGITNISSQELLSKCIQHLTLIKEFKLTNTTNDLRELFNQTMRALYNKITELENKIKTENNTIQNSSLNIKLNCFSKQFREILSFADESLMTEKRNIDIFKYEEGDFFKIALIYANNSLKNNCALN